MFETPEDRLTEVQLYELVAEELENNQQSKGLWAKAIADSQGNHEKVSALYIKLRVQMVKDEWAHADKVATQMAKRQREIYEKEQGSRPPKPPKPSKPPKPIKEWSWFGKIMVFGVGSLTILFGVFLISIPFITDQPQSLPTEQELIRQVCSDATMRRFIRSGELRSYTYEGEDGSKTIPIDESVCKKQET